jgi:leucyl aminopeptidase
VEFSIKQAPPEKQRTACIVVGVFESCRLSPSAVRIDHAAAGSLSAALKRGDMLGKAGTTLLLPSLSGIAAERVLLIGLGKEKTFGEKEYRAAIATALRALRTTGSRDAVLCLTELPIARHDSDWGIRQAIMVAAETLYCFDQLKSKKEEARPAVLKLTLCIGEALSIDVAEQALREGEAIATGMTFMKDLANLPGNLCTPTYLATQARKLGRDNGLKVEILDRPAMGKLGMHSLLAVARGSRQPPKFIVVHYACGKKSDKPIVLVGKGVTFDSGGISLKPGADMDEMKFDMSGAASVLATLKAIAQMKLSLNVIAVVPAVENMPGGDATRPGDIVTSMSGQTIEILNTDAEGRLILCDALTYVERFNPACVIDVATLTGACVIALGHVVSGLLANNDDLAQELFAAGQTSWDRTWQMPLLDDYQEQLHSNFADMGNIGGRAAGTITAACFLSRFAKKYDWAHLDIAGTAWKSGKEKGSTGRPVPLLTHFLINRAAKVSAGGTAKRKT